MKKILQFCVASLNFFDDELQNQKWQKEFWGYFSHPLQGEHLDKSPLATI